MQGQLSALSEVPFAEELKRALARQIRTAAGQVSQDFGMYFDRHIRDVTVAGLENAGADEGTIWLIDPEGNSLLPVFNSGPNSAEIVGNFRQSLRSGMISMVVATEQPVYENDVHWNRQQDRTLDTQLGVQTTAMIASPLYFAGDLRGVVSGVQLRSENEPSAEGKGFTWDHLQILQRTVTLLGRLIEHRMMVRLLNIEGWV